MPLSLLGIDENVSRFYKPEIREQETARVLDFKERAERKAAAEQSRAAQPKCARVACPGCGVPVAIIGGRYALHHVEAVRCVTSGDWLK